MALRIAFTGASGTGKTKLSEFIVEAFGLPYNPVGSRSVAKDMGFASPYDVDAAGRRAEFQRRLVLEKRAWEDRHESFVTDRTTLDNMAYTIMHDVAAIDEELVTKIVGGVSRYTHIFYCPVDVFCNTGTDNARVQDMTYHRIYDILIKGLLDKYRSPQTKFVTMMHNVLEDRKQFVRSLI